MTETNNIGNNSPLEGIRVLDVTQVWAGPITTMMLADLGAEVIKVEPPGTGDHSRTWSTEESIDYSPHFLAVNRNKKSVVINLKEKKGKELFCKLANNSDVLIENFRPGVMNKMGLDYKNISELNPQIIYCSISGFGQEGPKSDLPAYDMIIQGIGGTTGVTGEYGGRPVKPGFPQADIASAFNAAYCILAAVISRINTGKGTYLDLALLDSQLITMGYHVMNYVMYNTIGKPMGNAHPLLAPYETFETSTQEITIGVATEKQWEKFCKTIGQEKLISDERFENAGKRVENREILIPLIQEIIKEKPADYWLDVFHKEGIPCGPINTVNKVVEDYQVKYRNMVVNIEHPILGDIKIPGVPWKVEGRVSEQEMEYPPLLGQHTREVLKKVIELSEDELEEMENKGIIYGRYS